MSEPFLRPELQVNSEDEPAGISSISLASSVYQALPHPDSIRYMILQPGAGKEPLVCSLHVSSLPEIGPFEAISYVWGNSERNRLIVCNTQQLPITTNLHDALIRIRLSDKPRNLWADSICINQDNSTERGHQVSMMGRIYSGATRVLIHIGKDEEGHGPAACSRITELDARLQETFDQIDGTWDSFPFYSKEERQQILDDQRWASVHALIRQPWFSRGWVAQEAGLAKQALLLWGDTVLPWPRFLRCFMWIFRLHPSIVSQWQISVNEVHIEIFKSSHKHMLTPLYPVGRWFGTDLLGTLHNARALQLQDERDRIYAFQGLPSFTSALRIVPDYTKPFLHVYTDFARQYLLSKNDPMLLHYVQHDHTSLDDPIVPSWTPRWDRSFYIIRCFHNAEEPFSSSTSDFPAVEGPPVSSDNILKVKGVVMDCISHVSDVLDDEISVDGVTSLWDRLAESREGVPFSYSSDSVVLAFLTTLSLGTYEGDWLEWVSIWDAFIQFLERASPRGEAGKEPDHVLEYMRDCCHNRRFVVSRRGYFGLAPMLVEESDVCCIIFGCKSPLILRKTDREGHYRLVGEAFITGKQVLKDHLGGVHMDVLGSENSKDWIEWGLEEQDIYIC